MFHSYNSKSLIYLRFSLSSRNKQINKKMNYKEIIQTSLPTIKEWMIKHQNEKKEIQEYHDLKNIN